MIIESGIIVASGLLLTFYKCNWYMRQWMLSHPLFMDLFIFILLNALHWGTFSGMMVAATGALVCSGLLSLGRWAYGYEENGYFVPGHFNAEKLGPDAIPA